MGNRTPLLILAAVLVLCLGCIFTGVLVAGAYLILNPVSSESSVQAPQVATVTPPIATIPPTTTPTATPEASASCPVAMQDIIRSAQGQTYGSENSSGDNLHPESLVLATYPVHGDSLGEPRYRPVPRELDSMQHDSAAHSATWQLFTELIPSDQRRNVSDFMIFTDGPANLLASVQQSYDDPARWVVEVDAADLGDRDALVFTLVHEFAHLLTLSPSQVPPDPEIYNDPENQTLYEQKLQACPTYFPGEGCSLKDSYINAFYDRFWLDIAEEWQQVDDLSYSQDVEGYYEALYAFYEAHQDMFVDDYAVTNPSEDMAETFSYFIFGARPAGRDISEQKILFFHEYPELVELRERILQGFCEAHQ